MKLKGEKRWQNGVELLRHENTTVGSKKHVVTNGAGAGPPQACLAAGLMLALHGRGEHRAHVMSWLCLGCWQSGRYQGQGGVQQPGA